MTAETVFQRAGVKLPAVHGLGKDKTMAQSIDSKFTGRRFGYSSLLLATLLLAGVTLALSADDRKVETIDATARGTGTQLGKTFNVKVTIYEFSTPEDKQVLVDAFKKGQNQGLVNALTKIEYLAESDQSALPTLLVGTQLSPSKRDVSIASVLADWHPSRGGT